MSWAAYVTNLEGGKGRCKYAGIWGKQGGVWAESPDKSQFPISAEDVAVATRAVVNQDQNVMGTGLTVSDNLFFFFGPNGYSISHHKIQLARK